MFSGPGKNKKELIFAIKNNVSLINVESFQELEEINGICIKENKIQNY